MKLETQKHTSQIIWPAALMNHDSSKPINIGEFSSINMVENLIMPLIIAPAKNKHYGEKLPFTFVEPPTDNEIYLQRLAGFNLVNL